jgi:hypothetical protein
VEWWRSKRKFEHELYGEAVPTLDALTAEAMVCAEEEAIELLLDALASTRPPIKQSRRKETS